MVFAPEINTIEMPDEEFRLIRDLVYNYSGLFFDEGSKYLLEKRLCQRLVDNQFKSFREYYQFLKLSRKREQELELIMDLLTTNETYFFRESYQLECFASEIIPALCQKTVLPYLNKRLRIWSAGCSTGEEPYTIAMLLMERPELSDWQIEIIGTDISQRVLQQARRGVYRQSSFRMTDEYYIKKYFVPQDGGYSISDDVRRLVTISHLNLLDHSRLSMLGMFDVIFCRNVIIYFDNAAKKKVVESFHSSLRDGGYLLLGHSESLMSITNLFTLKHFKNDMVYQKPEVTGCCNRSTQ